MGNLDPSVEENAQNLGASPWKTFTSVTLPMATPGIAAAMLLVFVQSIADIGNPMLLGGDYHVLAAQVYFQLMGSYNPQGGAILAVILLIPSITAFVLQKFWAERRSYVSITGKTARTRQKTSDPLAVGLGTALCSTVAFIILLFYGMVFVGAFSKLWGIDYSFTLRNFNHIFFLRDTRPIFHTLQLSAVAAPISGIIGIIVAYVLVRKRFIGKNVLEVVSVLSLAVPGVILGIGYAIFFNKPPFILSGTATIIILSFVVRTMPIGIRAGVAGLQQIDPGLEEASANLGASSSQTLKRVVIPLLRPAFFAGLLNAFIRSMTSISAVIFLISARWQLLTAAILAAVEIGQLGLAAAYAAVLIVLTSVFMGLLRFGLNRLGKTPTDLSC
ncbi:MAG TPA: iron ABC transporter permease [Firmicutes bacterium]|nr:iron ABC transporter permease [Bacillota bacterium]